MKIFRRELETTRNVFRQQQSQLSREDLMGSGLSLTQKENPNQMLID